MNRMKIYESQIPLSVLYNPQVDDIKRMDKENEGDVRPLVFQYKFDEKTGEKVGVKIEIIGEDQDLKDV